MVRIRHGTGGRSQHVSPLSSETDSCGLKRLRPNRNRAGIIGRVGVLQRWLCRACVSAINENRPILERVAGRLARGGHPNSVRAISTRGACRTAQSVPGVEQVQTGLHEALISLLEWGGCQRMWGGPARDCNGRRSGRVPEPAASVHCTIVDNRPPVLRPAATRPPTWQSTGQRFHRPMQRLSPPAPPRPVAGHAARNRPCGKSPATRCRFSPALSPPPSLWQRRPRSRPPARSSPAARRPPPRGCREPTRRGRAHPSSRRTR